MNARPTDQDLLTWADYQDVFIDKLMATRSISAAMRAACTAIAGADAPTRTLPEMSLMGRRVLQTVTEFYAVSPQQVMSTSRLARLTGPRHVAAWLLAHLGLNPREVGDVLGRDRTTIIAAVAKVQATPRLLSDARCIANTLAQEGWKHDELHARRGPHHAEQVNAEAIGVKGAA